MKKVIVVLTIIVLTLIACLSGCAETSDDQYPTKQQTEKQTEYIKEETTQKKENLYVTYISNRTIYYDEEDQDIQFSFQFLDQNEDFIESGGSVKIRIENEFGEEVYNATRTFSSTTGTNGRGERKVFIHIYCKDIKTTNGGNGRGTLYYTITSSTAGAWSEYSLDISKGLPYKEITYSAGETWTVPNNWEFTVNAVNEHYDCEKKGGQFEQYIIITFSYKCTGEAWSSSGLIFGDFDVYDEDGEKAERIYYCDHISAPKNLDKGGKQDNAGVVYALKNKSDTVTIVIDQRNKNYDPCKATYAISVEECPHDEVVDPAKAVTCTEDGLTEGMHCSVCQKVFVKQEVIFAQGHQYVDHVCTVCGISDPNYVPTYSAGETWTVDGLWELSFQNAVQTVVKKGKQTVEVVWKYKNLGYNGKLNIGMDNFDVYDAEMEICDWTFHDVDYNNYDGANCIVGAKGTCCCGWILNNSSTTIKIYVEVTDSNEQTHKAYFVLDVVMPEEEPEEDKLNGCTITLGTSLPQTISYYTYSGSKESSCSVTDVSFEVSGDDLYIYFTGRKTYDSRGSGQSDSCKIGWKLYDDDNNVIASGTAYTLSLATGEGFVKTKSIAYDCITAGGTYKLVLLNVN